MKKKMIVLLAAALLALGASNAMAYFGEQDLIRVVYNTSTGDETLTDLGSTASLISLATTAGYTVGGGALAFTSGTNLGAGQDANLKVGYMSVSTSIGAPDSQVWVSATKGVTVNATGSNFNNYQNGGSSLYFFNIGTSAASASWSSTKNDSNDYINNFSAQNQEGTFGQFLSAIPGLGEASLATLASASIQQGLYYWADGNNGGAGTAINGLTILTNADGSTTLQTAAQTPIPAAIYLMGSGLLGMFGLRRKQRG
jgi:hypothetical protein